MSRYSPLDLRLEDDDDDDIVELPERSSTPNTMRMNSNELRQQISPGTPAAGPSTVSSHIPTATYTPAPAASSSSRTSNDSMMVDVDGDALLATSLQREEMESAIQRATSRELSQNAKKAARKAVASSEEVDLQEDPDYVTSGRCLKIPPSAGDELGFFVNRVFGQSNRGAIRLSQIISGDVQRCVLFNYCVDVDWMFDVCPQLQTYPRVDIATVRSKDKNEERKYVNKHPIFHNITYYSPRLPIMHGVHHSKMIILFYRTGVRVAIVTANFIEVDWIWKNNLVYVQDFPRKTDLSPKTSMFETDLMDYLSHYSKSGLKMSELSEFDFSSAKTILIPSVPGRFKGAEMRKYGHMKVRHILSQEPLPAKFLKAPIVAQYSSLGSVTENWLLNEIRTSFAASKSTNSGVASLMKPAPPPIKLVWPTIDSVRGSLEGWASGGSLCCDSKNLKPFLRTHLHRWDGRGQDRDRAMPHIKSYVRAAPDGEIAWCISTSANCSNSAWGQLQIGETQLQIRHYELGCLFLPSHYAKALAIIKQRGIVNFTCTPDQPIIYSPHGDRSKLPYFANPSDPLPAAAASSSAAVGSSPAGPVQPPVVRLMLLSNKMTSASVLQGSTGTSAAATSSIGAHGGTKRSAADANDEPNAKRTKGDDGEWQDSSRTEDQSTVPASAATVAPSPSDASSSSSEVFDVICPLPYNCIDPAPYTSKDVPWAWDVDYLLPDIRGQLYQPGARGH